jgi:hypothetical protein
MPLPLFALPVLLIDVRGVLVRAHGRNALTFFTLGTDSNKLWGTDSNKLGRWLMFSLPRLALFLLGLSRFGLRPVLSGSSSEGGSLNLGGVLADANQSRIWICLHWRPAPLHKICIFREANAA